MWFRKSKKRKTSSDLTGTTVADGIAALEFVESRVCDTVLMAEDPVLHTATGRALDESIATTVSGPAEALFARALGHSLSGLRVSVLTSSLSGVSQQFHSLTGKRQPLVVHLLGRATDRHASAVSGAHDDFHAVGDSGACLLFAGDVQEVADLTAIAHRIAEATLSPVVVAQDLYRTSHSMQRVRVPGDDDIESYLGRSGDAMEAPSTAQEVLLGQTRTRVPRLIDRDRPAGVGGAQDADSYERAVFAQRVFFETGMDVAVDDAVRAFASMTGRSYQRADGYLIDGAEVVLVSMGAVGGEVHTAVDHLRAHGVKAGAINVRCYRPFPGDTISQLLAGAKRVIVLDRTASGGTGDTPLTRDVRGALARAVENGAAGSGTQPHPGYASMDARALPKLISAVYGVGADLPYAEDIVALVKRSVSDPALRYFLGIGNDEPSRHFPHLQALYQRLERDYPGWTVGAVRAEPSDSVDREQAQCARVLSFWAQGGVFAANITARALATANGEAVRTYSSGGLEPTLQTAEVSVVRGAHESAVSTLPPLSDAIYLPDGLLAAAASHVRLTAGARVTVAVSGDPQHWWTTLAPSLVKWVSDAKAKISAVDVRGLGGSSATAPTFSDQLAVWTLMGRMIADASRDDAAATAAREHIVATVRDFYGDSHPAVDDVTAAVQRGLDDTVELDVAQGGVDAPDVIEPAAPWTVARESAGDGTVFDATRFWHSVGYLYNTGRVHRTLADPHLAAGLLPAGTSAHRDMTPFRISVPQWLPENCTACGNCWALCPDSALPSTAQPVDAIVRAAIAKAEQSGPAMMDLSRAVDNLAKLAYRRVNKDGLGEYREAAPLLRSSFDELVEKMGLEGEKRDALQSEFDRALAAIGDYTVAKTQALFDDVHAENKGGGLLLSIAVNPNTCKGCGLCAAVCPDDAMEMVAQTAETVAAHRAHWDFQMSLPPVPDETLFALASRDPGAGELKRLLDSEAYHSLVGGDESAPGNGIKIAMHLVTASVDSEIAPRYRRHVRTLDELIASLENKIQGKVSETVRINDFESFARRLDQIDRKGLTGDALAGLAGGDSTGGVDKSRLDRMAQLRARLIAQRSAYAAGRARLIACLDDSGATYPDNPHRYPWVAVNPDESVELALGLIDGVRAQLAREVADCRRARLEIDETYDADTHEEELGALDWESFSDEERDLAPCVVVFARSGHLDDAHVLRLLSRGHRVLVTLLDANGVEDLHADTWMPGRDFVEVLHRTDAFVAQSSISHPGHLIRGVREAVTGADTALVHVHAPVPQTSGVVPEDAIRLAELAVRSRLFPLWKRVPGQEVMCEDNGDADVWPTREWSAAEPSGAQMSWKAALTPADWVAIQSRFANDVELVSRGKIDATVVPVGDYLAFESGDRETHRAYVDVVDSSGRRAAAIVSPRVVSLCDAVAAHWQRLSGRGKKSAVEPEPVAPAPPAPEPAAPAAAQVDEMLHQRLAERLLALSGYSNDPDFFKQSLREFVTREVSSVDEGGDA